MISRILQLLLLAAVFGLVYGTFHVVHALDLSAAIGVPLVLVEVVIYGFYLERESHKRNQQIDDDLTVLEFDEITAVEWFKE